MRRTFLVALALLFALVATSGAAEPRIAAGVTAGGTDVSNLTLAEATDKLSSTYGLVLLRPLSTHVIGHKFGTDPIALGFSFDAAKTARRAFNAGLKAKGQAVDVDLYVGYDTKKLTAYAGKVAQKVERSSRDAQVRIRLSSIGRVKSRDGRDLDTQALIATLRKTLADPSAPRILNPKLKKIRPNVTTNGLKTAYGTIITIDRGNFKLRLFKGLKLSKTYGVAVGMPAYPTPTGLYSISNKAVNPAWTAPNSPWAGAYANETVAGGSAENPLKARWMGIVNGVGIHGTGAPGSIGSRASHGCIRMTVPTVIDLYPRVPVGTPVLIGN